MTTWYVDTVLNLIRLAGDYVSEEVWYRIVQVVINTQEVQEYAAKTCFEVRKKNKTKHSCVCVCVCVCERERSYQSFIFCLFVVLRLFRLQLVMRT